MAFACIWRPTERSVPQWHRERTELNRHVRELQKALEMHRALADDDHNTRALQDPRPENIPNGSSYSEEVKAKYPIDWSVIERKDGCSNQMAETANTESDYESCEAVDEEEDSDDAREDKESVKAKEDNYEADASEALDDGARNCRRAEEAVREHSSAPYRGCLLHMLLGLCVLILFFSL